MISAPLPALHLSLLEALPVAIKTAPTARLLDGLLPMTNVDVDYIHSLSFYYYFVLNEFVCCESRLGECESINRRVSIPTTFDFFSLDSMPGKKKDFRRSDD